jgi:hypothetical protein
MSMFPGIKRFPAESSIFFSISLFFDSMQYVGPPVTLAIVGDNAWISHV